MKRKMWKVVQLPRRPQLVKLTNLGNHSKSASAAAPAAAPTAAAPAAATAAAAAAPSTAAPTAADAQTHTERA